MDVNVFLVIFGVTAMLGGIATVLQKHPINAGMSLVLTFLSIAGMYALLDAHFLAFIQIIVYVGAVMVLIIYTIMLMDIRDNDLVGKFSVVRGIGAVVALLLLAVLVAQIPTTTPHMATVPASFGTVAEFGKQLFGRYLIPFEVASILLLAAIVGALHLARPSEGGDL